MRRSYYIVEQESLPMRRGTMSQTTCCWPVSFSWLMLHKMEVLLTNLLASMDIGDAFLQVDLKCEPRTRVCHPQEPSWTKTGSTILVLVLQKLLGGKV